MKSPAFDFIRAESLAQACDLLSKHGDSARLLAGGQSLLPALNMRLQAPELLIDLGDVAELRGLSQNGQNLRIGAMTRHVDLMNSHLVADHAPLVAAAIHHVAHAAIRNRGTIGGNLAHADPASELPACMLALDATLISHSPRGERRIAAADFFLGMFTTALEPDELLTAIEISVATGNDSWTFDELARRNGDYAIVGLCTRIPTNGPARLAFFSVGDRPTLAHQAATVLQNAPLNEATIDAAVAALDQDLEPQSDLQAASATRLHLARVLLARALKIHASRQSS